MRASRLNDGCFAEPSHVTCAADADGIARGAGASGFVASGFVATTDQENAVSYGGRPTPRLFQRSDHNRRSVSTWEE